MIVGIGAWNFDRKVPMLFFTFSHKKSPSQRNMYAFNPHALYAIVKAFIWYDGVYKLHFISTNKWIQNTFLSILLQLKLLSRMQSRAPATIQYKTTLNISENISVQFQQLPSCCSWVACHWIKSQDKTNNVVGQPTQQSIICWTLGKSITKIQSD